MFFLIEYPIFQLTFIKFCIYLAVASQIIKFVTAESF